MELAYGERLRRDRATKASRRHLAAALEHLQASSQALGGASGRRAARGGLTSPLQSIPGPVSLTAQEREIALLAATGLSNKQIGERLFLSHRTIGAHLYQIFPKLGMTSRAALRDALANTPEPDKPGSSE